MQNPLDEPLFSFSEFDHLDGRNACEGVMILGAPGSGKTSIVGKALALQLLQAGMGGLILTSKVSETARWLEYAKISKRSDDVIVFSEESGLRFDPLAYEWGRGISGGDIEAVIEMFGQIINIGKPKSGGGEDRFWEQAAEQLMRNVIYVLSAIDESVSIASMDDFIQTMPSEVNPDFDEWSSRENNYCGACLQKIVHRLNAMGPQQQRDLQHALRFIGERWPRLAPETRGSVEATWSGMSDRFTFYPLRDMFSSGVCDFTPRDCTDRARIIIVHRPMLAYGQQSGMQVNGLLKLVFQRDWLSRTITDDTPLTFCWQDEAQMYLTPGTGAISKDNLFQQMVRESRIIPIYLTQNILNIAEALGEHVPGAKTKSFLGNIRTKVFLQQNDVDTNNYASELIGRDFKQMMSRGHNDMHMSLSISEQRHYRVEPHVFTSLAKPIADWFACEGIVYQGGEEFNITRDAEGNGRNYLRILFQGN